MKTLCCALLLALLPLQQALAWVPEGHSIIAEIAQRETKPSTRDAIDKLLHHGTLASVASWADDVKFTTRPETYPWHFVDIPLDNATYAAADCRDPSHPQFGNVCLVTALDRLKTELSCTTDDAVKRDYLRLAVHLIGDSTQPLHTVEDLIGGNGLFVKVGFCGLKETNCHPSANPPSVKFHELWDGRLISETFYSWGAYDAVLPIVDRQLGIAGLRLARYLDAAFAPNACSSP